MSRFKPYDMKPGQGASKRPSSALATSPHSQMVAENGMGLYRSGAWGLSISLFVFVD